MSKTYWFTGRCQLAVEADSPEEAEAFVYSMADWELRQVDSADSFELNEEIDDEEEEEDEGDEAVDSAMATLSWQRYQVVDGELYEFDTSTMDESINTLNKEKS